MYDAGGRGVMPLVLQPTSLTTRSLALLLLLVMHLMVVVVVVLALQQQQVLQPGLIWRSACHLGDGVKGGYNWTLGLAKVLFACELVGFYPGPVELQDLVNVIIAVDWAHVGVADQREHFLKDFYCHVLTAWVCGCVFSYRSSFLERYGAAGTPADQRRESPIVELSLLLTEAVQHGLVTIAFCKSRKMCELVTAYTREHLKKRGLGQLAEAVKVGGRGGPWRQSRWGARREGRQEAVKVSGAAGPGQWGRQSR